MADSSAAPHKPSHHSHAHGPGHHGHGHHGHGHHGHGHGHGHHHDHQIRPSNAEEALQFFDRVADQWEHKEGVKELNDSVLAALQKRLPWNAEQWKQAKVMDFGCGVGMLSLPLSKLVGSVTALDGSAQMVSTLVRRVDRERVKAKADGDQKANDIYSNINADVLMLSEASLALHKVKDERFDLIVTSMVAHHLLELPTCIKLLSSMLKQGGYLAIFDLFQNENTHLFHAGHVKCEAGVTEDNGFSVERMSSMYEAAGITPASMECDCAIEKTAEVPQADGTVAPVLIKFPIIGAIGQKQ